MKKNKTQERVRTVLFMLAVTLVTVSAVSGLHIATDDIVRRNENLFLRTAVLRSAGLELPSTPAEISSKYDELVRAVPEVPDCYTVGAADEKCVFVRTGPGLWGDITAVVCFDTATDSIVGVTFTKQNETPGLGGRIDEEWFQTQFRGKQAPVELVPEGTASARPGEVDAITGATITSKAVRDIVNRASVEAAAMAAAIRGRAL